MEEKFKIKFRKKGNAGCLLFYIPGFKYLNVFPLGGMKFIAFIKSTDLLNEH